jgi:hypothetical protein
MFHHAADAMVIGACGLAMLLWPLAIARIKNGGDGWIECSQYQCWYGILLTMAFRVAFSETLNKA